MRHGKTRDMAASVKARLLQIGRVRREEFQNVLTRYAIERLLYRLSCSEYRSRFVLKGANVFALWEGTAHRPTRDVDLLGYGDPEIQTMVQAFQAICQQLVEDDGLLFEPSSVAGAPIREGEKYAGVRVTLGAMLGKAVIPVQIDVGFGDVVTPEATEADLPTLLDFPKARLLTYPRETVVAEKCEALVDLGLGNTRLKDFYDLWHLATHFDFDGPLLCRALSATFKRRGTAIPILLPNGLSVGFYGDVNKQKQWTAFWQKSGLSQSDAVSLEGCVALLRAFLLPPLRAIQQCRDYEARWRHGLRSWYPHGDVGADASIGG